MASTSASTGTNANANTSAPANDSANASTTANDSAPAATATAVTATASNDLTSQWTSAASANDWSNPAPSNTTAAAPQSSPVYAATTTAGGPSPIVGDCEMFPSNAIFNTRIDGLPAAPNSWNWISMVGGDTPLMPNWGNSSDPSHTWDYWGMPINVIDSSQTQWPIVNYDGGYAHRSDCATAPEGDPVYDCSNLPQNSRRFPFPSGNVLTEGNDDKHVLVIDRSSCHLWEAFSAQNYGNGQWNAVTTASWDLRSNKLRPKDSVSADAAGLPIAPLLAKSSEAATGEIRHAMRVTFRNQFMSVKYNWPARTGIGLENDALIPFGALLRLRADFVIPDNWSPQAKAVATAFKRYGLYVADNGQDFFVQGEPSDGWDPVAWQQLRTLNLGNMEFVDTSPITSDPRFDPNSMQASW